MLLVSAADKLHNARAVLGDYRTVGEEIWNRFKGGKDGTLWYYRAFLNALREHPASNRPLVDELGRVVEEMEKLASQQC